MVKLTNRKSTRALLLVLAIVLMGFGLSACGTPVYSAPDEIKCVYNKRTGELIKQLQPGEGEIKPNDEIFVVAVPTSQRFWNIDPDPNVRDPGASEWVTGYDKDYKQVRMNPHAEMFLKSDRACEFVTRHLKRNMDDARLASSSEDKAGFNARGNREDVMREPWFTWLREKFDTYMVLEGQPLLSQFTWQYYQYIYPVNADVNGVLPCKETGPDGLCTSYEEAKETARNQIERQLSENLTRELDENIGDFFCGVQYDPKNPDFCPPVKITISKMELVVDPDDPNNPIKVRETLNNQRDATNNAKELARLTEESTAAEVAKKQADVDKQNALAALEGQYLSNQEVINQAEIIRAEHQKRLDAINQANATCVFLNASAQDCALIIAAESGQYPQGNGQSVTINPSQQPQSP